jgi:NADH dehydrogenase
MAGLPVLVLGGSGFVGRHVVNRLVEDDWRVIVPTRRRERAKELVLLPTVDVVEADVSDPVALAKLATDAAAVINLVGILHETDGQTFARAHVELANTVISTCRAVGVRRLVHMSALNADVDGPSRYLRSKGEAAAAVMASGLDWTIFEPSVIFGREDSFLNLFARLARMFPVLPLAGANVKFQPVYVGDVAHCHARALALEATIGRRYPLCGPAVYTLRELVRYVAQTTGAPRPIVPLSPGLAKLQATVLEHMPGTLMTRDNLASMSKDSVCGGAFAEEFEIAPTALEAIAPSYLSPEAWHDRYDAYRVTSGR